MQPQRRRDAETQRRNLVMVMTPKGVGAIAVIRLRGEGVGDFLEKHFSKKVIEGKCVHGEIRDGEIVLDDAVVVREGDFVDLNLHGGVWVVRAVLELAERYGFEVIEDALEMMDGGTVLEREVMAALPLAGTELGIAVLLSQVEAWKSVGKSVGKEDAAGILKDESLWWLLHTPTVAIVGVPNVGKSTLANQLFARERSIVADVAGTTRDWVGELANIDGLMVMLVDTPGIRGMGDEIEREAIERSGEEVRGADLVIVVLDQTQGREGQMELVRKYPGAVVVVNKVDRKGEWEAGEGIRMVAIRGEGVEELRREIRRRFGVEGMEMGRARWWTERQREILGGVARGEKSLNEI